MKRIMYIIFTSSKVSVSVSKKCKVVNMRKVSVGDVKTSPALINDIFGENIFF